MLFERKSRLEDVMIVDTTYRAGMRLIGLPSSTYFIMHNLVYSI
jgi:hypothetical protein